MRSKKKEKLSIKIGSREEVFWTRVKEINEEVLANLEEEIKLKKAVIEMAEQKIKEETDKENMFLKARDE